MFNPKNPVRPCFSVSPCPSFLSVTNRTLFVFSGYVLLRRDYCENDKSQGSRVSFIRLTGVQEPRFCQGMGLGSKVGYAQVIPFHSQDPTRGTGWRKKQEGQRERRRLVRSSTFGSVRRVT